MVLHLVIKAGFKSFALAKTKFQPWDLHPCMAGLPALVVCSWRASLKKLAGHLHAKPWQHCFHLIDMLCL